MTLIPEDPPHMLEVAIGLYACDPGFVVTGSGCVVEPRVMRGPTIEISPQPSAGGALEGLLMRQRGARCQEACRCVERGFAGHSREAIIEGESPEHSQSPSAARTGWCSRSSFAFPGKGVSGFH